MSTLFLGSGDLGWRTMAMAIREATSSSQRSSFQSFELGASSRAIRSIVPKVVRKTVDFSFWRRGDVMMRVLEREGFPLHIHCFGHQIAAPKTIMRAGASYSVTLDSTERQNLDDFPERAKARGRFVTAQRLKAEYEILSNARFICCTSEWARSGVIHGYGIDETKVFLNPFPTAGTVSSRCESADWLTFVGNDIARKGGNRVVEWHQKHFADRVDLHIVSSDPSARRFIGLPRVVFHGELPNAVVRREIFPRSRLLVLPTWYDQSPIAVTEAAAAGVPVVASQMAGIPELVVDEVTGFTPPASDDGRFVHAIGNLVDSDGLNSVMGCAAAKHYEANLKSECSVGRLFRLVDEALAQDSGLLRAR